MAVPHSFETPPAPIPDSAIAEVLACDVVVVGAGISGTPAAMKAAEMGASVRILEKGPTFGTHRTGGFAAFGTKAQKAVGIELPQELSRADPDRSVGLHHGVPGSAAAERPMAPA